MDAARSKRCAQSAICEHDLFERFIVCDHRDDDIAVASLLHLRCEARAELLDGPGLLWRSVVHGDFMPCLDEVRRHAGAHLPDPDESHFHVKSLIGRDVAASLSPACRQAYPKISCSRDVTVVNWYQCTRMSNACRRAFASRSRR